ncbi:hypothetical protein [Halovenus salina]|uniref:Uncharacterized protein n=1 Tax=Halovenus salina TaxID=1510225 RepID=A0ABD5W1S2_9EURY|nr:hypothetical protein [Halovenus salina]
MTTRYEKQGDEGVEYIYNTTDETVTLVADRETDGTVPPTEWITEAQGESPALQGGDESDKR